MGILYLFQFTIEYRGLSQPELFRIWVKEADVAMKASKGGGILRQIWKVVGERKVYAVLEVDTPDQADVLSFDLPIMKEFGDQVHIDVTPLLPYENFAPELDRGTDATRSEKVDVQSRDGIFYWLHFKVNYDGLSQEELFRNWAEEAADALKGKKAGVVVDLWKAVAQREVHAIVCVNEPEAIDAMSFDLPILKKMGDKVSVECKSLRSYNTFYEDLKKRLSESDVSSK